MNEEIEEVQQDEVSSSSSIDDSSISSDLEYHEQVSSSLDALSNELSSFHDDFKSSSSVDYTSTLEGISSTLIDIKNNQENARSSSLEDSSSERLIDLETSQALFVSLILGVLICYLFVCNLTKK